MKKIIVCTIAFVLLAIPLTSISADSGKQSSAYHFYAYGYLTSTQKYWTQYDINANATVGSGIKMGNYPTEVVTGVRYSKVISGYASGAIIISFTPAFT